MSEIIYLTLPLTINLFLFYNVLVLRAIYIFLLFIVSCYKTMEKCKLMKKEEYHSEPCLPIVEPFNPRQIVNRRFVSLKPQKLEYNTSYHLRN